MEKGLTVNADGLAVGFPVRRRKDKNGIGYNHNLALWLLKHEVHVIHSSHFSYHSRRSAGLRAHPWVQNEDANDSQRHRWHRGEGELIVNI
jgi:hypothetical protein